MRASIARAIRCGRRRCGSCAPGRSTARRWIFVNSLGLVLAIGFGGRAVLRGEMQVGSLVAFHHAHAISLRAGDATASAQSAHPGRPRGGRTRFRNPRRTRGAGLARRRALTARSTRRDSLRRRGLQLCARAAGVEQHQLPRAPGRDDRARRLDRRGQIDPGESAHALLRIHLGRDHDRRPTAREISGARVARKDRRGRAGKFSLQRHDPGKSAARKTGGDR